jgi:uncharacterized damage-inducible protein DinB
MRRTLVRTAILAATILTPLSAMAQTGPNPMLPEHGQRYDVWFAIDLAQEDVLDLAEAMPAEKYTFRPAEGVRTAGEVYMHIAEGNFTVSHLWGKLPPAGVDPKSFEKDATNKEKVLATLKASYAFLRDQIKALSEEDMNRIIQVYDHPGTIREALLFVSNHNQAHLGQSIAYARAAGVVPPWTAAKLAAEVKKKETDAKKSEKPNR